MNGNGLLAEVLAGMARRAQAEELRIERVRIVFGKAVEARQRREQAKIRAAIEAVRRI